MDRNGVRVYLGSGRGVFEGIGRMSHQVCCCHGNVIVLIGWLKSVSLTLPRPQASTEF